MPRLLNSGTLDDYRDSITENEFMKSVISHAEYRGFVCYHTYFSKRSQKGFPDLVMVRTEWEPMIIFAELKRQKDYRVSPEQKLWLAMLQAIAALSGGLIHAHLWRPSDWPAIEALIGDTTRDTVEALAWQRRNADLYPMRRDEAPAGLPLPD